ncbi:MAG: glycosyltransferase [Candidatus Micrarchaeota archaeon]
MLSVLIPTHNEEKRIGKTLEALVDFRKSSKRVFDIVLVDDGCDATARLAKRSAKVFQYSNRLGKGGAINVGLRLVKGDVLLYDADAACSPKDAFALVDALKENDVAIASRYVAGAQTQGVTRGRFFASRILNLIVRVLFGLPFADTQCGFKAMRSRVAKQLAPQLFSKGFVWDVEFLYRARKNGFSIAEIPVSWKHVSSGPLEAESVSKIAFKMLRDLLVLRFKLF